MSKNKIVNFLKPAAVRGGKEKQIQQLTARYAVRACLRQMLTQIFTPFGRKNFAYRQRYMKYAFPFALNVAAFLQNQI